MKNSLKKLTNVEIDVLSHFTKQVTDMDDAMAQAIDIGENDVSSCSLHVLHFFYFCCLVHVILH